MGGKFEPKLSERLRISTVLSLRRFDAVYVKFQPILRQKLHELYVKWQNENI